MSQKLRLRKLEARTGNNDLASWTDEQLEDRIAEIAMELGEEPPTLPMTPETTAALIAATQAQLSAIDAGAGNAVAGRSF